MKRTLNDTLAAIRKGTGPRLILLHGDDFQVSEASRSLLDLWVPTDQRTLNLECFDGRSSPWDQIEAVLRTPPLFPGTKTVVIENAPYFLSRDRRGDLADKIRQLWGDDKKDEAARLLLDLMVLEGWTPNATDRTPAPLGTGHTPSSTAAGKGPSGEMDEILAYGLSRGMDPGKLGSGQNHGLPELIEEGLPPWICLLITTPHVDKRTRLYRRLDQEGAVLDLSLERERNGRIKREALAEFLDRLIRETGKTIEPRAKVLLLARAGDELWGIHHEMGKLFLYVGEQPRIREQDVEEVFSDEAGTWVFDLTAALAKRDTLPALGCLARLLSQGEPPLKILGTIASDVRKLLAARHFLEGEFRGKWKAGMTFQEFQRRVLSQGAPTITQNPYGDYMSFQRAGPFTSEQLLRYLHLLYETDIRLKSTGKPPRMAMERLILEMCQERTQRHAGYESIRPKKT